MIKLKLISVYAIAFVTIGSSVVFVSCNKSRKCTTTTTQVKSDFTSEARKKKDPYGPQGKSETKNCLRGQGNCMWAITTAPTTIAETTPLYYLTLLTDSTLLVEYNENIVNEDGNILVLNDGFYLPDVAANNQEKESIQVLPGTYVTTYNTTYGEKILNVICK